MARYMGDESAAQAYRRLYESGKRLTEALLFNGEDYHQMLPASGDYQLGASTAATSSALCVPAAVSRALSRQRRSPLSVLSGPA